MEQSVGAESAALPGQRVDGPVNVSPAREAVIKTVAVIALMYATYWIYWRWTSTSATHTNGIVHALRPWAAGPRPYVVTCQSRKLRKHVACSENCAVERGLPLDLSVSGEYERLHGLHWKPEA